MQRFKDLSEEELAELIAKQQELNPNSGKRKLRSEQLAEGLKMFNEQEKKVYSNKFVEVLLTCLVAIGKSLCWPMLVVEFIKEQQKYKQYTEIVRNAIDTDEEVFAFMERFHFYPAWFTRLYSVQDIPQEFVGVDEDILKELTIQSIMPVRPMLAKANLLSILTLRVERLSILQYVIILEPENFQKCYKLFWWMVGSILCNVMVYVFLFLICSGII